MSLSDGKGLSPTLQERFWRRAVIKDGCWSWIGSRNEHGYGILGNVRGNSALRAHRVSWWIHYGLIPRGMFVCHHCDNPECSNPGHLFLGGYLENNRDARAKGRSYCPRGEDAPSAKLTEAQVREIRASLAHGAGVRATARRFGIDNRCIRAIRDRESWAHVD